MNLFSATSNGISFNIRVTPKAAQNRIGEIMLDENQIPILKVYVTKIPDHGKANDAVKALLAKAWKLSKSQIIIKKGLTDRNKLIHILGDSKELLQHLKKHFLE
jgi:uncharacterized protein